MTVRELHRHLIGDRRKFYEDKQRPQEVKMKLYRSTLEVKFINHKQPEELRYLTTEFVTKIF